MIDHEPLICRLDTVSGINIASVHISNPSSHSTEDEGLEGWELFHGGDEGGAFESSVSCSLFMLWRNLHDDTKICVDRSIL